MSVGSTTGGGVVLRAEAVAARVAAAKLGATGASTGAVCCN